MYRQWKQTTLMLAVLFVSSFGSPTGLHIRKNIHASASLNSDAPISFDEGGNVGVNMGGFHASAGLGGIIDGDKSKGGLHAEAGTPFGQNAGAGVKGVYDENVHSNAGFGFAAEAHKESTYGHKTITKDVEVLNEKTVTEAAKVVNEHTYQEAPQVHRTVIEKTVIPQYVEKTIQVPTYVEKTIRVPTVVEHKVRVPVTPKITENTYEEGGAVGTGSQHVVSSVHEHGHHHGHHGGFHKHIRISAHTSGGAAGGTGSVIKEKPVQGSYVGYGSAATGSAGVSANGYKSGTFFTDIFNIPVATLGAVGNFLGNLGGNAGSGAGGSFYINKSVSHGHSHY